MEIRSRRLFLFKQAAPTFDVDARHRQLLNSIYEDCGDNPLNAGQLKVVMKHLRYALVVGWENRA